MEYQTYAISQEISELSNLISRGEVKTSSEFYETQQKISWLKRLTDREIEAIRKEDHEPTMDLAEIDWFKEQIGNNHLFISDLKDEFNAFKAKSRLASKIEMEV
jgi:hypothetical protein